MQKGSATENAFDLQSEIPAACPSRAEAFWRRMRMPATRRARRGMEGQALVEFALTLPFLILLFVVLVELGLLLRSHMTVVSATRDGVRTISSRGNADPAVKVDSSGKIVSGNDVNTRVGFDGDLVMVQNVNTALQQERQSVTLLMTYRADVTEIGDPSTYPVDPTTKQQVATKIGLFGLGGAYGVFYNPNISKFPFQEIFDYVTKTNSTGQVEKWFVPNVMSTVKCSSVYGTSAPAKPDQSTPSSPGPNGATNPGYTYGGPAYCGDASRTSDNGATGIDRRISLGKVDTSLNVNNNARLIAGQPRFPGGPACTQQADGSVVYSSAIQCWRYNFAPWYPSLRRSQDVGLSPSTGPTSVSYQNNQYELASDFGKENPTSGNRAPDYAGVQISYTHNWFLSFFPGSLPLSDRAVKVMEPVGGNFNDPAPSP
ncbi:MAG TPA: TadE/TadG family type IV pilus assembly protein [Chloroflexia bacterium]|nr:TadE/TadG family type IV pilus assembly protein [Chloroflexia bacterium]